MPPKARTNSRDTIEKEGRILLAISALKKQEISNIREAARVYNIPRSTLQDRLRGKTFRNEARANSHKLTQSEEESLVRWILSIDQRGAAPRPSYVREMANILLAKRGTTPIQAVGEKWVYNFIKRRDELKTRFSRRYNHQRAKCEDPKVITEWFNRVQVTRMQYGIADEDIYNFDETGFAIGLVATAKDKQEAARKPRKYQAHADITSADLRQVSGYALRVQQVSVLSLASRVLSDLHHSAHVRNLRLSENSANNDATNTATPQASSDCQQLEYNPRRPKNLQDIYARGTRNNKTLSFRTPLLFVDKFWNINITGINSGWDFSIRSYNVIPDKSAIIHHCQNGNIEEIQRLFDNHLASPFDCDEHGWSLLHRAVAWGQLEVCKFLFAERRRSHRLLLELNNSTCYRWVVDPQNLDRTINLYRLLLRDNEDVLLEKHESTVVGWDRFQGPTEALKLIQESLFANYASLPIELRFRRAMSLEAWNFGSPGPEMLRVAMGGDSIDSTAIT
ncbi:hypothetical protein CNMCM7691_000496 [Aspergillus felis]|uniref:HTH CENPB-type domain-containing protein n=1 Tax=Aspergillus felis TaxID=1287682 RepID=A0A8H6QYM9_9EURO|nr:hypothetical protein CNMCM7691_000496 [Aspergillus felis]